MTAASWPSDRAGEQRLLVLDSLLGGVTSTKASDLASFLRKGDLLVVNDAATFPASIQGKTVSGDPIELRLLPKAPDEPFWTAVVFGAGDWKTKTEDRPAPPSLYVGERLILGEGWEAKVNSISPESYRLIRIEFNLSPEQVWREIYARGKPVQYSYLKDELELWSVQNFYGSRPWASEMPSAGRILNSELLLNIQKQGIKVATLTHATGLSSTGDRALDEQLPLPEFFSIPSETVKAVYRTRKRGGRVVAVGTSVMRALEGQAHRNQGVLVPGFGRTGLKIGPGFRPRFVFAILTGIHEVGESHFRLLEAFANRDHLKEALRRAEIEGYLTHEFGDAALIGA